MESIHAFLYISTNVEIIFIMRMLYFSYYLV